jgi:hypothetical protein
MVRIGDSEKAVETTEKLFEAIFSIERIGVDLPKDTALSEKEVITELSIEVSNWTEEQLFAALLSSQWLSKWYIGLSAL